MVAVNSSGNPVAWIKACPGVVTRGRVAVAASSALPVSPASLPVGRVRPEPPCQDAFLIQTSLRPRLSLIASAREAASCSEAKPSMNTRQ